MNRSSARKRQSGFTLIELLTALAIFLLVTGAAFSLLGVSQKRYQTDSQVLNSFQEARLGLDEMIRNINDSGFPPPTFADPDPTRFVSSPFAWSPNYPGTPCAIGVNCISPGDFDLIVETNINPQDPNATVSWIRYQLQGTTLMRGVTPKVAGGDPDNATIQAGLAPFVQNVANNAVPMFSYTCDTSTGLQPCPAAGADNSPVNIRDIEITLIVATPQPDAQTGQPRLVELHGRGRRINPNQ